MPPLTARAFSEQLRAQPPPSGCPAEDHATVAGFIALGNPMHDMRSFVRKIPASMPPQVLKQSCSRWMLAAIQDLAKGGTAGAKAQAYMTAIKGLLGNGHLMMSVFGATTGGGSPEMTRLIAQLHATCTATLEGIAVRGERVCAAKRFRESLAPVGEALQNVRGVRLDNVAVVGDNPMFLEIMRVVSTRPQGFPPYWQFSLALYLMNLATEAKFTAIVTPIIKATGGKWKSAPPKNDDRMCGKIMDDHASEAEPRSCANIDGVRGAATYGDNDIQALKEGFKAIGDHPLVTYLRVKNAFAQEKGNFGYRAILVNLAFTSACNETWGDVLNSSETQAAWDRFINEYATNFGEMMRQYPTEVARRLLGIRSFCQRPFGYIGEVQFILQSYLDMRKDSHFWYKILRTSDPYMMMNDFAKYSLA